MPAFHLPKGYTLYDPAAVAPAATRVPGQALYKGADISRARDAAGAEYVGCCAKNSAGVFAFRVFRQAGGAAFVEVPLPETAPGRGEIGLDRFDGRIHYIAWLDDSSWVEGVVPGCAPFQEASGAGYTPLGERVFHARDWQGREVVKPSMSARAYNVRLTAAGPAGARLRCGPSDDPMQALTVQTQGPRAYETGVVAAGDAGLVVWTEGALAEVYVDVLGALG